MAKQEKQTSFDHFPDEDSVTRLRIYEVNERLLNGDHFAAYSLDVGADQFTRKYKMLKYATCNFAGLISKVIADTLFGEKVAVESKTGNKQEQDFIDELFQSNKMQTQLYESELLNSARGDAVFRIRIEDDQIKVDDINPAMYFPVIKKNYRDEPEEVILAWREDVGEDNYLIKEIYTVGKIEVKIFKMKGGDSTEVVESVPVDTYNLLAGTNYVEETDTKIKSIPIIHIPNFRTASCFWGSSDYHDLQSLFFAINNRVTKIDEILNKHSDPILQVPEGILDEDGKVNKENLGMVELREGEGDIKYVVWDANLDSAFKEIDQIVKMIFMFSEISPDVLGVDGDGTVESGRALKLRMVRTLAKKNRKALYYESGIQRIVEIASEYANAGYKVGDISYKGEVITPNVLFADGVIDDKVEEIENETRMYEAGLTTRKRAVKVIEDADDETAEKIVDEIKEEKKENADFTSENMFHIQQSSVNNSDDQQANAEQGSR